MIGYPGPKRDRTWLGLQRQLSLAIGATYPWPRETRSRISREFTEGYLPNEN